MEINELTDLEKLTINQLKDAVRYLFAWREKVEPRLNALEARVHQLEREPHNIAEYLPRY
jgi:hypothetical protein